MKKSIFILSAIAITISLSTLCVINWIEESSVQTQITEKDLAFNFMHTNIDNNELAKFIYDIGPRFSPIKMSAIKKANSIKDILDDNQLNNVKELKSVSFRLMKNDKRSELQEIGTTSTLTKSQLTFINSLTYSTSFVVETEYVQKNPQCGKLELTTLTPHYTVVPEVQAEYEGGKESLMEFLRENSLELWKDIDEKELQPAKLFFTVTKSGAISNIYLDRTSNFPKIDKRMKELLSKVPGNWNSATNSLGEKVDQELVVSFGLVGC